MSSPYSHFPDCAIHHGRMCTCVKLLHSAEDAALGAFVRKQAKDPGPAGVVPRNLIRTFNRMKGGT